MENEQFQSRLPAERCSSPSLATQWFPFFQEVDAKHRLIPGQGWGSSFELGTVPEAPVPSESKPLVPRKLGTEHSPWCWRPGSLSLKCAHSMRAGPAEPGRFTLGKSVLAAATFQKAGPVGTCGWYLHQGHFLSTASWKATWRLTSGREPG